MGQSSLFPLGTAGSLTACLLLGASLAATAAPSLMKVPMGTRTGYADAQGRLVVPPKYLEADEFEGDEPLARVVLPRPPRVGFIDSRGVEVAPPVEGHAVSGRCAGIVARQATKGSERDGPPVFFGPDGAAVPAPALPPQAELAALAQGRSGCWMLLSFENPSRHRPMRLGGPWLGDGLGFDSALEFACVASASGQDGPCLAPAVRGGRWGFVDEAGRWAVAPRWHNVQAYSPEGLARADDATGGAHFIDAAGRVVLAGAGVQPVVAEWAPGFVRGLVRARTERGWGLLDREGRWVVAPQFAELGDVAANGLAAARVPDGRWAYVSREGQLAIQPTFRRAEAFSALGLAAVVDADGCHRLVNASGHTLAGFDEAAREFQPDSCGNGALMPGLLSRLQRGGWPLAAAALAVLAMAALLVVAVRRWQREQRHRIALPPDDDLDNPTEAPR